MRLGRGVVEAALVTVAAIAGTLPLLAWHFGQISLVALPANLLVTPLFPLIFAGSGMTAIAGSIDAGFGEVAGWLAWLPLAWSVEVGRQAAAVPAASVRIDGFGALHAALLFAALLGVAARLGGPRSRKQREARGRRSLRWRLLEAPTAAAALGIGTALSIVVWPAVLEPDQATLDLHVLDVGQGDSLLAVSPSGATLLVDGGPDGRRVLRELGEVLPRQRRIDVMVATHPQADHVTGLFSVLERYEVGTLLVSPVHASRAVGQRLLDLAEASGTRVVVAEPGMLIEFGADVALDVLGPSIVDPDALNDSGVVLRLRHGEISMLLTADIEAEAELRLAREPWTLQSNVLKVGHHGSATSTTDLLLRRVRPSLAVISAGAGNQFGHPQGELLSRLTDEAETTLVVRTDVDGRIRLRSNGVSLTYRSVR